MKFGAVVGAQARRVPDRVAVACGAERLTFGDIAMMWTLAETAWKGTAVPYRPTIARTFPRISSVDTLRPADDD